MRARSEPAGFEVHTPPCLAQKVQPQRRAAMTLASPGQSISKEILRQWQLPTSCDCTADTRDSASRQSRNTTVPAMKSCTARLRGFAASVMAPTMYQACMIQPTNLAQAG